MYNIYVGNYVYPRQTHDELRAFLNANLEPIDASNKLLLVTRTGRIAIITKKNKHAYIQEV